MRRAAILPTATQFAIAWHQRRTLAAEQLPPPAALAARKRADGMRISICIPALNEEATIGAICRSIRYELMEKIPLVDELIVLDGASTDATAVRALAAGAKVADIADLLPEIPLVPGKGEALWRGLTAVSSDIVVWIDADIRNFAPHFVSRLVAPLLFDERIDFVKGFYERPIRSNGALHPDGGGRVTELLARPLLDALFPELAGFLQPLAGEYAGRTEVLRRIPFLSGYSVEVAMLIDLLDVVGLEGLAQVDLGRRIHRNRPLAELGPMAYAIAQTIMRRAEERGRITSHVDFPIHPLLVRSSSGSLDPVNINETERPPIDLTPPYVAALRAHASLGTR